MVAQRATNWWMWSMVKLAETLTLATQGPLLSASLTFQFFGNEALKMSGAISLGFRLLIHEACQKEILAPFPTVMVVDV